MDILNLDEIKSYFTIKSEPGTMTISTLLLVCCCQVWKPGNNNPVIIMLHVCSFFLSTQTQTHTQGEIIKWYVTAQKNKICTKTHIGFSCGTKGELQRNMIKVCCGVTLYNVTASHIQKQRTTTAPHKTHHRGCFSYPGGEKREKNRSSQGHQVQSVCVFILSYKLFLKCWFAVKWPFLSLKRQDWDSYRQQRCCAASTKAFH